MPKAFQFQRFANIRLLRRLDFELLVRLLTLYRFFLEGKNEFQWTTVQEELSFEKFSKTILSLDSNIPEDFLRLLYFVYWFSNEKHFDPLFQTTKTKIPSFANEITLEDLVLTLRLKSPGAGFCDRAEAPSFDANSAIFSLALGWALYRLFQLMCI